MAVGKDLCGNSRNRSSSNNNNKHHSNGSINNILGEITPLCVNLTGPWRVLSLPGSADAAGAITLPYGTKSGETTHRFVCRKTETVRQAGRAG